MTTFNPIRRALLGAALLFLFPSLLDAQTPDLSVTAHIERPYIEKRGPQQIVNFDLLVHNRGDVAYDLVALRLTVRDREGKIELIRELNENGKPPALDVLGQRHLSPGADLDIFQPFTVFDPDIDLTTLHFDLLLMKPGHAPLPVPLSADAILAIDVHPHDYSPPSYLLPLHGVVLVHDGHDFYSHHRRYNLLAAMHASPPNLNTPNLYAYDLVRTDPDGHLYLGDPLQKENWLTYGAPIYAPADGIVEEAVTDLPENSFSASGAAIIPADSEHRDPNGLGNHIILRHSDGRFSWLLHMQPQSLRVKAGAHVTAGQLLGNVGFTGDSLFPHLHYTVTHGPTYPSEAVPSCFRNFDRILGMRRVHFASGQIDTGDIIESLTPPKSTSKGTR
jgi:hypothetical protein